MRAIRRDLDRLARDLAGGGYGADGFERGDEAITINGMKSNEDNAIPKYGDQHLQGRRAMPAESNCLIQHDKRRRSAPARAPRFIAWTALAPAPYSGRQV